MLFLFWLVAGWRARFYDFCMILKSARNFGFLCETQKSARNFEFLCETQRKVRDFPRKVREKMKFCANTGAANVFKLQNYLFSNSK